MSRSTITSTTSTLASSCQLSNTLLSWEKKRWIPHDPYKKNFKKITHYRKTTDSYLLLQAPQGRQETFTQYERKLDSIHKNHKANETEVGLNVILSSSLFLGFKHWHIFGSDFALKSGLCHLPSCSSILSHSSRMKCLMWRKLSVLLRVSARILPGVPTTIWGEFFFSSSSSFFIDSPC